ncbi:MAG: class I adenylate-forming enzyme family protein [Lachnospiraceae bacterium]|nr:class I adenylate-forming enzyme family protein [Lachnospiraceae bacterium]
MSTEQNLTGKPSIDRPWMKYYPDMMLKMISLPECTIMEYLKQHCPGQDVVAMHYYGEDITWKTVFEQSEKTARALKALGFGVGDQIPVFLRLVPEFIFLLLGAEKIGASLLCRDNTIEENVEAAKKADAKAIIAQDFLSQKELNAFLNGSGVEKAVLLSPTHYGDRNAMPSHIQACLDSCYPSKCACGSAVMSWEEFIAQGERYTGEVDAPIDIDRPLFRAYTSGSTGPSKQVIHSANTMLGIICQMNFYGGAEDFRPSWMVTCLPPALVAVIVSMVLLPMSSNKLLILDPFCYDTDVDLELMRYKANNWPIIPRFMEVILRSSRIPEDYDLSHLLAAGAGCEAFNNSQMKRAQKYLRDHNCNVRFTTGYGCSEAGSNLTLPMAPKPILNGNVGVAMPLGAMSIFKPGTQEELTYNQLGEICKTGPGNMLGYDNPKATAKTLQVHEDGNTWLHTGDIGYMDEDGVIYSLGRGDAKRYGGGELAILPMENRIADAEIKGIDDEFFVLIEDDEHKGYFIPYLYVVLTEGVTVEDIRSQVNECLDPHMQPADIIALEERPFFHFKTNRLGLARELKAERNGSLAV